MNFCLGFLECFPFPLPDKNCATLSLQHSNIKTVQSKATIMFCCLFVVGLECCSSPQPLFTSGESAPPAQSSLQRVNESLNHVMHPKIARAEQEM